MSTKRLKVLRTNEFDEWLKTCDIKIRTYVLSRLDLLSIGHLGNHKRFEGLIELRWKNGTRVYSFYWGSSIVVALIGGSKHGQKKDINKAKKIRDEILEGTRSVRK